MRPYQNRKFDDVICDWVGVNSIGKYPKCDEQQETDTDVYPTL